METTITVALITGVSLIVSVIVSSLVSFRISRRTLRQEAEHRALDYFHNKIQILQQKKTIIIDEDAKTPPHGGKDLATNVALAINHMYKLTGRIFREIKHYFPVDTSVKLEKRLNLIKESMSYHSMLKSGFIKEQSEYKGDPTQLLEFGKLIDEMVSFTHDLESLIDNELRSSIKKIEDYSSVHKTNKSLQWK